MEYYSWQTMLDEYRWMHKHEKQTIRNLSDDDIRVIEMNHILTSPFRDQANRWRRMIRLTGETAWVAAGRPYYNVHPQMVGSLCKTNLNKIPAQFIEVPADLPAVVFRFADPVPTRYADNTGYSVIKAENVSHSPIYCRSVLFGKIENRETDFVYERVKETLRQFPAVAQSSVDRFVKSTQEEHKDISHFLTLCIDEGVRLKDGGVERTLCNIITISCRHGQTISEAIQTTVDKATSKEQIVMLSMGERLVNLLRVIISSGFLANCPEDGLVVPDVLGSDRQSYREAEKRGDQNAMSIIAERAKRRGKFGFNIGTSEMFAGESEPVESKSSEETGRQLSFSHIRGGHPHAVRYGEGKGKVKIKWFRPTRVRPDLPFKGGE